jgi:hypothetical protein
MRQSIGRFVLGLVLVTGVSAGAGLAAVLVAPGVAGAATTLVVNDALDGTATPANCTTSTVTTGPDCTLRAALEEAQNLAADVTITVPDAALVENNPSPSHIYQVLSPNQLDVSDSGHTVTIDGANDADSILQAQCTGTSCSITNRVLEVENGTTAVISDVTIEDGNPSDGVGGGILNDGTLTLDGSEVQSNAAADSGGGIEATDGASTTLTSDSFNGNTQSASSEQGGGGIFVMGESEEGSLLDITGSTFQDNVAAGDGGAITLGGASNVNTVATIDSTNIYDNVTAANGGGIAQDFDSTLTVTNSAFGGDQALGNDGGGVFLEGDSTSVDSFTNDSIGDTGEGDDNTAVNGGGVFIGEVDPTFTDVTIDGNIATTDGGGVFINSGTNSFTDGSISSNRVTGNAGHSGGGVFIGGGTNSFSGVAIDSNQAQNGGYGGGVYISDGTNTFTDTNVNSNQAIWTDTEFGGEGGGFFYGDGTNTFSGGSIDSNQAYEGGAAYLDNSGTETFTQADLSSNFATESAGGLWVYDQGIDNPTTISSSTISQNSVGGLIGQTTFLGDGGGILSVDCNQINLTNDTIAGNTATALGGGYYGTECNPEKFGPNQPAAKSAATPHIVAQPTTNFLFDTIDANTSGEGGGNLNTNDTSTLNASETIIADGVSGGVEGDNCTFTSGGTVTSLGYNLIDDTTCGTPDSTDIIGQPAQLGALGNNGGPTNTELPASTSPAVGAVPAAVCTGTGVTTDQRGNARGAGLNGSCTIGAVEVSVAAPPAFNPNGYRLVANEGGIFDFGLNFNGSLANNKLNAPIVGIANAPGINGYLMAGGDGGVFALGGANFFGSLGGTTIPSPIANIAAPPTENGYWLVAQNGKIYNFGAVPALPAIQLPTGAHIVGMASTQDGQGAWLTDQLGDVYAEGDAQYVGGLGGVHLNAPIVGIAAAANGQGYVLAASDGGVFNYGTQGFFGSVPGSLQPGQSLVAPIVGIAVTHSGNGYWLAGADGGVFNYGDAPFLGSIYTAIPGKKLNGPIVGIQHLGEPSAT